MDMKDWTYGTFEYVTLDDETGILQSPERTIHVDEKRYFNAVFGTEGGKVPPKEIEVDSYASCCTECENYSNEYYVIGDGFEYYCSDQCLHKHYTPTEYEEMFEQDNAYWTNHD